MMGEIPHCEAKSAEKHEQNTVLIVYDSVGQWGWSGYLNALFLTNLLGHFDAISSFLPVENYTAGMMTGYDTTFYLGTHFNNPLPEAFIKDVLITSQTVVWFRYNLWRLMEANPNFASQYGFVFEGLDASGYDQIIYKNTVLSKDKRDPELGRVLITDSWLASELATALQTATGRSIPYIVHGANLWYIADIPFTYTSENDRYLAFSDVLYEMLRVMGPETRRALIRLEDISAVYDPAVLMEVADYLFSEHVPFAISVIPYYTDPLGYYAKGVPQFIKMTDKPRFIEALRYMQSKGGTLILHGYTHQYSNMRNEHTGVSADDYEFFRVSHEAASPETKTIEPLSEDSEEWVASRVKAALSLLNEAELSAGIWETPHYTASSLDNYYFAKTFRAVSGRVLYFDKTDKRHHSEQFFPYVIHKDSYGQKVIPENLGYIAPVSWFNFFPRTVEDLLVSAKKNLVIRDAWASFYYHPYLGLSYLKTLIPGIRALGYEFVPVSENLN